MLTHHLVLLGLPGAGKSTVGQILARVLGMPFVDTDQSVVDSVGSSIPDIFASEGESTFRTYEAEAIRAAVEGSSAVISVGGGALTDPRSKQLLRDQYCVYLDVSPEVSAKRVGADEGRPLLQGKDDIAGFLSDLAQRRTPDFAEVANLVVSVDSLTPGEVAQEVVTGLQLDISVIEVATSPGYEVVIGSNLQQSLAMRAAALGTDIFLVHPPTLRSEVRKLKAQIEAYISGRVVLWEHADAEAGKTVASAEQAWETLGKHSFGRDCAVIGFGGGATTDLAGFIASTWLRGVPVLMCATSLLGMVDAAVGGKTGINTAAGKNLVGTFYTPAMVFCDLNYLQTLPTREFYSGTAEILKCGYIRDSRILELIDSLESQGTESVAVDQSLTPPSKRIPLTYLRELIARAIQVKADVVSKDFRESGLREILNYGHTFGHAVERVENYSWLHGEAVAVGMLFAHSLAVLRNTLPQSQLAVLRSRLQVLGLPTSYDGKWQDLLASMRNDKKVRAGVLRFVLLSAVSSVSTVAIDDVDILFQAAKLAKVIDD